MNIAAHFKGQFIATPEEILEKLKGIKAFVFDWDGVFNSGQKSDLTGSPFNEVDSMGTNLIRFNHFLRTGNAPIVAVISGESNNLADYITACNGSNSGVRECAELLTGLSGLYDETLKNRIDYSEKYQQYLEARNKPETLLFVNKDSKITQQRSL